MGCGGGKCSLIFQTLHSTFNFSVPELSWLTALLLFGAMLVLHFIPMRALLLMWGIIKFSKRIIRPHTVTNNEILDLLSRVPDDEEMVNFSNLFPKFSSLIRKLFS